MKGYCLKCRKMREMKNEKNTIMKNGRPAVQGEGVKCGTKMMKIVSATLKNKKKNRGTRKNKTASKKK